MFLSFSKSNLRPSFFEMYSQEQLLPTFFPATRYLASVLATLSNIGPGFGTVGPTQNFAAMRESTLLFLSGLMVLGRLELFAILVLFVPAAWRRY